MRNGARGWWRRGAVVAGVLLMLVVGVSPWAMGGIIADACGPACGKPWGPGEGPNAPKYVPPPVKRYVPLAPVKVVQPAPRVVISYPTKPPAPAPKPAPTNTPAPPTATAAPVSTTCTAQQYLARRGMTTGTGDAKDMRDALLAGGFTQVDKPQENAVAVFQPGYFKNIVGFDAEKRAGFSGMVTKVESETQSSIKLTIHGALPAMPGNATKLGDELGCNDLADVPLGPYGKTTALVAYYVR